MACSRRRVGPALAGGLLALMLAAAPVAAVAAEADPAPQVTVGSLSANAFGLEAQAAEDGAVQLARVCPMRLDAECTPASIQVGIDCGMADMCGLDPCLCGSADAWGGCSCNGLADALPQVRWESSDDGVVRVVQASGTAWAVPVGPGTAELVCTASLAHHDDGEARVAVTVGAPTAPDAVLAALAVLVAALVAAVVVAVRRVVRRRRPKRARGGGAALCALLAVLCAGGLSLSGCQSVSVDDQSPRVSDVAFLCKGTGTEEDQSVEVRLSFDAPIMVQGDPAQDFTVLLNGQEPPATVAVDVRPSAEALTFVLHPSEEASMRVTQGDLFALYQGAISIASARSDGALPGVTGAAGSTAVLDFEVAGTLPSGVALAVESQRPGSQADNLPAETVVRVTSPALVRALTWFSPDGGQTVLLKHNHTFAFDDAADCAADLADAVNRASGIGIGAKADGDRLILTAAQVTDGQMLEPLVVEGVGVAGGSYDPQRDGDGES